MTQKKKPAYQDAPATEASGGNETPLSLVEDVDTGHRFLIYATKSGTRIDLQVDNDSFWASQAQMAETFGVTRQNVTIHLQNIFKEGELLEEAVCKESLRTGPDGKSYRTKIYDINAVISVGYRVGGALGTAFRMWATDKLVQYLTKGFVVDAQRLKQADNLDRISELREIIRDIRASEANVYAELRRICAFCQDYDPSSETARTFYARMQAKLFWAVTAHTPSQILSSRPDSTMLNMGLTNWSKDDIRQSDAVIAKNYLGNSEIKELNRLTTILLDIFDDQAEIGKLVLMAQASALLDLQLRNLGRTVLSHGGNVTHADAEASAKAEYRRFDERRRAARLEDQKRELAALAAAGRAIPRKAR